MKRVTKINDMKEPVKHDVDRHSDAKFTSCLTSWWTNCSNKKSCACVPLTLESLAAFNNEQKRERSRYKKIEEEALSSDHFRKQYSRTCQTRRSDAEVTKKVCCAQQEMERTQVDSLIKW